MYFLFIFLRKRALKTVDTEAINMLISAIDSVL